MKTAFTYGAYSAIIAIVITLIEYFTGLDRSTVGRFIGFLGFVGLAVMIYLAIKARKEEEYNGFITYGQSVGTGTMVALCSSVILAIFMYVYISYINPDLVDYIVSETEKNLADKHMPADQMAKALSMTRTFAGPSIQAIFTLLGGTLIGLIISLIMGIFTKSKGEEPQLQM